MSMPFEYTADKYAEDKNNIPSIMPGKPYDRTDIEAVSAVPVGGPGVYGRAMVKGPDSGRGGLGERFSPTRDGSTVCLPDFDGEHLKTESGVTFSEAGIRLETQQNQVIFDSELIFAGVGVFTEAGSPHPCLGRLSQPFGLNDKFYQEANVGQMSLATEGNIWCYTESDVEIGDSLVYMTSVSSTDDGTQLLGAFASEDFARASGRSYELFAKGKVLHGGPAGGLFVLSLNGVGAA